MLNLLTLAQTPWVFKFLRDFLLKLGDLLRLLVVSFSMVDGIWAQGPNVQICLWSLAELADKDLCFNAKHFFSIQIEAF